MFRHIFSYLITS